MNTTEIIVWFFVCLWLAIGIFFQILWNMNYIQIIGTNVYTLVIILWLGVMIPYAKEKGKEE